MWWRGAESGGKRRALKHRARVAITPNRDDLPVQDVNVFGERNRTEDCVDGDKCDTVLPVGNQPVHRDAFHNPREMVESLSK